MPPMYIIAENDMSIKCKKLLRGRSLNLIHFVIEKECQKVY